MNYRATIRWLIVPAILLPMLIAVMFGLMGLLSAIDDAQGESVVRTVGILLLTFWIVNIAVLTLATSLHVLSQTDSDLKRDDHQS